MLAPYIPDFKVHVRQGNGGHILANCGYGFEFWRRVGRQEERFHLLMKGSFAGIVEAEKEDGVF